MERSAGWDVFCPLLLCLLLCLLFLLLLLLLLDVPPFLPCRVCSTWIIYIYTLRSLNELTQAWHIISVRVSNNRCSPLPAANATRVFTMLTANSRTKAQILECAHFVAVFQRRHAKEVNVRKKRCGANDKRCACACVHHIMPEIFLRWSVRMMPQRQESES